MWLKAVEIHYLTPKEIAEASGLSVRQIQRGLKRARREKIDFETAWDTEWIMNPNPFTEEHQCAWHGKADIPKGVKQGCLFCLRGGLLHLIRSGRRACPADQKPEPKDSRTFAERKHGKSSGKPSSSQ
jgi:hypothetical protein